MVETPHRVDLRVLFFFFSCSFFFFATLQLPGAVQVIADAFGNVKGTVANSQADPPLRPDGKLNVGAAVGRGVLAVVRSHPSNDRPYSGMVPITSGRVTTSSSGECFHSCRDSTVSPHDGDDTCQDNCKVTTVRLRTDVHSTMAQGLSKFKDEVQRLGTSWLLPQAVSICTAAFCSFTAAVTEPVASNQQQLCCGLPIVYESSCAAL